MDSKSHQLLTRIARCPDAVMGVEGALDTAHPCHKVIASQGTLRRADGQSLLHPDRFHVPEPWQGDLASARLLFISSNPSIDPNERFPTLGESDQELIGFFEGSFPRRAGSAGVSRFWTMVQRRATELYGRPAAAGVDYALTEVVRCKSRKEAGVAEASQHCADRWLAATLEASAAQVIVVLGTPARARFSAAIGISTRPNIGDIVEIEHAGRTFLVGFVNHPSYSGKKGDKHNLDWVFGDDGLRRLRAQLVEKGKSIEEG